MHEIQRKEKSMRKQHVLGICLGVCVLLLGASVFAQMARPTHSGTVWEISFIHVKPGMGSAYDKYLASDWKKEQEALKAAGMILSYKVIGTEAHSPNDWDLMLMVEFKDLATLEANEDKADAMLQKMFGGDEKVMQGFRERSEIREVLGTRLAREIILEPKK
jgi:hypothetical protein